jgi:hypothetical protein
MPTPSSPPSSTTRPRLRPRRGSGSSSISRYLQSIARKRSTMNKYGLQAQEHWRRHAPSRYAALEDPPAFFEDLGQAVANQVADLTSHLESTLPADLPYLERVAQLRAIQKQAEDQALTELVFSVEPETTDLAEELEQLLGDLPDPARIEDLLQELQDQAEEEAQRQGFSTPVLTEEQEQRRARLLSLLPLVTLQEDPERMDEQELTRRILALRSLLPGSPA